ncbi:MAG: Gfo/Idh/MocA family protein [Methanoregula sp.]
MKYLVAGFGSIGKRHLENIKSIDSDASVTIWHTHSSLPRLQTPDLHGDHTVYSFEEAIQTKPDVAFITNPASFHIPLARLLANEGIDLFIEKPLSSNLQGVAELQRIHDEKKNVIMIGYNLRFHHPFQVMKRNLEMGSIGKIISFRAEVGQYLPDWRPDSDYRNSVSARKDLGGGAVFELSHELDYVRWFLGEVRSVISHVSRSSDLAIDVEDTADIIMEFANGAVGNVHLDMVQRFPTRYCRIIGSDGTLFWDGTNDSVSQYSAKTREWSVLSPPQKIDRNEMYLSEIRHFIECVKTRNNPLIGIDDGKKVLEIAIAVLKSSDEKRCIVI